MPFNRTFSAGSGLGDPWPDSMERWKSGWLSYSLHQQRTPFASNVRGCSRVGGWGVPVPDQPGGQTAQRFTTLTISIAIEVIVALRQSLLGQGIGADLAAPVAVMNPRPHSRKKSTSTEPPSASSVVVLLQYNWSSMT